MQHYINSGEESALALLPYLTKTADWQPTNIEEIIQEHKTEENGDPVTFNTNPK